MRNLMPIVLALLASTACGPDVAITNGAPSGDNSSTNAPTGEGSNEPPCFTILNIGPEEDGSGCFATKPIFNGSREYITEGEDIADDQVSWSVSTWPPGGSPGFELPKFRYEIRAYSEDPDWLEEFEDNLKSHLTATFSTEPVKVGVLKDPNHYTLTLKPENTDLFTVPKDDNHTFRIDLDLGDIWPAPGSIILGNIAVEQTWQSEEADIEERTDRFFSIPETDQMFIF